LLSCVLLEGVIFSVSAERPLSLAFDRSQWALVKGSPRADLMPQRHLQMGLKTQAYVAATAPHGGLYEILCSFLRDDSCWPNSTQSEMTFPVSRLTIALREEVGRDPSITMQNAAPPLWGCEGRLVEAASIARWSVGDAEAERAMSAKIADRAWTSAVLV